MATSVTHAAQDCLPTAFFGAAAPNREEEEEIPLELCRAAVAKVAASATFSRAAQLRRLLEWLGERSLEISATRPSEKDIAAFVLNRPDFDPQADSLVRKEMSRLRDKLSRYYLTEGARDPVGIVAGAAYRFTFQYRANSPTPIKKRWAVLPFRARGEKALDAGDELFEQLWIELHRRDRFDVISPFMCLAWRVDTADCVRLSRDYGVDVMVEGSLRWRDGEWQAAVWLTAVECALVRRVTRLQSTGLTELVQQTADWLVELD